MKIAHISAAPGADPRWPNWGDRVIVRAMQDQFNLYADIEWHNLYVRNAFGEADVDLINSCDLMLLGGGGLIMPRGYPTGWQWNITTDQYERIKTPMVMLAVGWNFFGDMPGESVRWSLNLMAQDFSRIALRHEEDQYDFEYHVGGVTHLCYCPSILIEPFKPTKGRKIGLLLALDRGVARYGSAVGVERVKQSFTSLARRLWAQGYDPCFIKHIKSDYTPDDFPVVDLTGATVDEGVKAYQGMALVVTTRGHGQMIPQGLGCKVVSAMAHPKIKRFVDDFHLHDTFTMDLNAVKLYQVCQDALDLEHRDIQPTVQDNVTHNIERVLEL